ncbi:MAG: TVP38/TMEM64 family protein [Planctomycetota bacterium]
MYKNARDDAGASSVTPPANTRGFLARLGRVVPATFSAASLPVVGATLSSPWLTTIGASIAESAPGSLLIFVPVGALIAALCLVPTHLVSLLAGIAMGPIIGVPLALLIVVIAAAVNYALSLRIIGRRVIDAVATQPRLAAIHSAIQHAPAKRRVLLIALFRLSPAAPFGVTNLALASAHIPFASFLLGSLIGMTPRATLLALLGDRVAKLDAKTPLGLTLIVLGIAVTVLLLVMLTIIAKRALAELDRQGRDEGSSDLQT